MGLLKKKIQISWLWSGSLPWWRMCTSRFAAHAVLLSVQKGPEATRVQLLVLVTLFMCEVWGRQQLNTCTSRPQNFKKKKKLHTWTLIFRRNVQSESSLAAEGSWAAVKINLIRYTMGDVFMSVISLWESGRHPAERVGVWQETWLKEAPPQQDDFFFQHCIRSWSPAEVFVKSKEMPK